MTLENLEGTIQQIAQDPTLDQTPPPAVNLEEMDPDDLELQQARAAVAAEEAARANPQAQPGTPPAGAPGVAPTPTPLAPQPPASEPPQRIMIPKERLDEALSKKAESDARIAFLEGQLAATRQFAQPPGTPPNGQTTTPPPVAQPPADPLAEVKASRADWAKKFDNGDITFGELQAELDKLADREHEIRADMLVSKVRPAAPPPSQGNDLYLEALTNQLEKDNPDVVKFYAPDKEQEWNFIVSKARAELEAQGVPLDNSAHGKYVFRKAIAEQATIWAPKLIGSSQGQAPQPPAAPQLSQQALARQGKLDMAAGAPPDLTALPGTGSGQAGGFSAAQIEAMTEDEIMALPAATRAAILGHTTS